MLFRFNHEKSGASLMLTHDASSYCKELSGFDAFTQIVLNAGSDSIHCDIEYYSVEVPSNNLLMFYGSSKVLIKGGDVAVSVIAMNRAFVTLLGLDDNMFGRLSALMGLLDASCVIPLNAVLHGSRTIYTLVEEEVKKHDSLQLEMLIVILRKFIIQYVRTARHQHSNLTHGKVHKGLFIDFERKIEEHYKTNKSVVEFAKMLNKSPKTLANQFAFNNLPSPLQVIQSRIVLEAKRMLFFTDKSIKEIALELGYDEAAPLSKLFKRVTGTSIKEYKTRLRWESDNDETYS